MQFATLQLFADEIFLNRHDSACFHWAERTFPLGGKDVSNGRKQRFQWAEAIALYTQKTSTRVGRGSCCLFGISCLLFMLQRQRGLLILCSCCCGPS
jgi:hypothetical protein